MTTLHATQALGNWHRLTLYEQMGNIGTELGRVFRAKERNDNIGTANALARVLELFDLTVSDPNRRTQLKEILRAKELFLNSISDKPEFDSSTADIDRYFMQFAIAARLNK